MTTNSLPTLPNLGDIETKAVLKNTARAHHALMQNYKPTFKCLVVMVNVLNKTSFVNLRLCSC